MPIARAVLDGPPKYERTNCFFMERIIGMPICYTQGAPTSLPVRLTYMTLAERVALALNEEGRSQTDLAKAIGVRAPSVNDWISGKTKTIKGENLLRAASFLRVRPEWLSMGRGPMRQDDLGPAISTPLRPVRLIDSDNELEDDAFPVPRYTVKASAGNGAPVLEIDRKGQSNYCRTQWAKRNGYRREDLFSIVTIGDSMEPTIPDGASLIVHKRQDIVNGKVHVICRGDECFVKRLFKQMDGSVLVKSDNQANYKDWIASPNDVDPLHVVGLVVSVSFNL